MSLNILIVDDSSIARSVITKTIKLSGVPCENFLYAENGREGLDVLRKNCVDVALLDINMPVMTGIEMADEMLSDEHLKSIPVIIISTEGSATVMKKLQEKGVKGFIRKPFTPEKFCHIFNEVLGTENEKI